jgi:uncharacterized membrane protein YphA (DoxX/SURF4 family)
MSISKLACLLLVVLRLVLGWHFLVEGYFKIRSHQIGKTSTNTPWTSEPFFREAYGPMDDWYRERLGLSDEAALAKINADRPIEWDQYANRLSQHYDLNAEQRSAIQARLDELKQDFAGWLKGQSTSTVSKPAIWGTTEVRQTVPERLAEYEAKKKQAREIQDSEQPAFNQSVNAAKARTLKLEAARILNDLITEFDARTAAMKAAVVEAAKLADAQKAKGELPEPAVSPRIIQRLDKLTMWMQAILGGFLLIGLFTRFSSLVLAGFLLQVVLLMPALPSSPTPPGEMGHYMYVDMHVIEMVALLVLAAIPTGKWFGLDALFGRSRLAATRSLRSGARSAPKTAPRG